MNFRSTPGFVKPVLALLALATVSTAAPNPFHSAGFMHFWRYAHSSTLLPDGKVLIAGGSLGIIHPSPAATAALKAVPTSAELYDPARGTWTATGSMITGRNFFPALLLKNGKVLVVGGGDLIAASECYDPETGLWSATAPMHSARNFHTMTLLPNGKVFVVGGDLFTSGANAELYDPQTDAWTLVTGPGRWVVSHTSTLLADGTVLVAGDAGHPPNTNARTYNPATDTWTDTGPMYWQRDHHTATLLLNGKVLITGGRGDYQAANSAELYDPDTRSWTLTGPMATGRWLHTATLLPDGRVLITGGQQYQGSYDSAELYDPATNLWTDAGQMSCQRSYHAATLLRNGKVLITGSPQNYSEDLYDPGLAHGTYNGLVRPAAGTAPGLATTGFFSAAVQDSGAFTGRLLLDGLTVSVAGVFDGSDAAHFGAARTATFNILRPNKSNLILELHRDLSVPESENKITGVVTQYYRSVVAAVSIIEADSAFYEGRTVATSVPPGYLGKTGAAGVYSVVLPAKDLQDQPTGFTKADYPQGDGFGTVSITKAGTMTFAGRLADGSAVSAAVPLARHPAAPEITFPLFARPYALGFISATVVLDSASTEGELGLGGDSLQWSRPFMNTQYYPYGWPEIIVTGFAGAKYAAETGKSVLKGLNGSDLVAANANGNTTLDVEQGLLAMPFIRDINLSGTDAVTKLDAKDKSFTLAITRGTGQFTGTFIHADASNPAFQGIIYQKGTLAGGHGYFLTTPPRVKDYTGQSGVVRLIAKPLQGG